MTSAKVAKDEFYVYVHYDGDELVYCGKGLDSRAWAFGGRHRTEEHSEFMKTRLFKGDSSFVKVLKTDLTKEEALEFEQFIIQEAGTLRFNIMMTEKHSSYLRSINSKSIAKTTKWIMTPKGKFYGTEKAGLAFNKNRRTISTWCRDEKNKEFYYVRT